MPGGGRRTISRSARLPARQSALGAAAGADGHQAAPLRPLGNDTRSQLHLCPPQPRHQGAWPRHDLHLRSRPRRPWNGRQYLARRHLQRDLPEHPAGQGRDASVQAVQLPGRHPEPRRTRDAGIDPRRRRARLFSVARLWRRSRQPRPDRCVRRRRWRSRDRRATGA